MQKIPQDMYTGSIHSTLTSGKLKVIKYINALNVNIEFISTGYKTTARSEHIRKGSVKDYLHRSVHGVGFIGVGEHSATKNGVRKAYDTWSGMLERCYCKILQKKAPTYIGCTVCPEWHNFQNFAKWFKDNYIDGYDLDKDIKIQGNKLYSPDTCLFVTQKDNSIAANAISRDFINPFGERVSVYNITAFCKDNGLDHKAMHRLYTGRLKTHRGWKIANPT